VWFPIVGLAVGAAGAGVRVAAGSVLPAQASTLLALLAILLITGALHEDGLADLADGLGAHVSRERRLEILRDPRIGTFGALALIIAVGLTVTTVGALNAEAAARTLIVAHVLSRWAILVPSRLLPPARPGGSGALLRVGMPALLTATALAGGCAVAVAGPAPGAVALAGAALAALLCCAVLRRGLGGVTGDGYGATAKVVELTACCLLVGIWA
jgi:adenosylcobinamide-GDP ribazoletransferase